MILVDPTKTYKMTSLRQKHWCHMISDLTDPAAAHDELMAMAAKIGSRPEWLQREGQVGEHFDLVPSKRSLAIVHGAKAVDSKELIAAMRAKEQGGQDAPAETPVLSH